MKNLNRIIISRTDGIGDVVLTLPVAHLLKEKFPGCSIIFLGKTYTKPVIESCTNIDKIVCWDEIVSYDKKKQIDVFCSLVKCQGKSITSRQRKQVNQLDVKLKRINRIGHILRDEKNEDQTTPCYRTNRANRSRQRMGTYIQKQSLYCHQ